MAPSDDRVSPTEWVELLRAWDGEGVAAIRHGLHQGLSWVLSRYGRRSARAVTQAISLAMAHAIEGRDPIDDVDVVAVAMADALRRVRLSTWDDHASARWLRLRPGWRFALAVIEVEQVQPASLSRAVPLPPKGFADAYESACRDIGLAPLGVVACPGWPNVTRMYRSREDDASDALLHVQACPRCRPWHLDRDQRRALLADLAPAVGATGIGFALAPAGGVGGIGGPARNVGFGSRLSVHRRGRSTLWH